jgi:hypothetical protein
MVRRTRARDRLRPLGYTGEDLHPVEVDGIWYMQVRQEPQVRTPL